MLLQIPVRGKTLLISLKVARLRGYYVQRSHSLPRRSIILNSNRQLRFNGVEKDFVGISCWNSPLSNYGLVIWEVVDSGTVGNERNWAHLSSFNGLVGKFLGKTSLSSWFLKIRINGRYLYLYFFSLGVCHRLDAQWADVVTFWWCIPVCWGVDWLSWDLLRWFSRPTD